MKEFLERLADILEVEKLSAGDVLRDIDGWDSLKAFGILVMIERNYKVELGIERFQSCVTAGDLYEAIGG